MEKINAPIISANELWSKTPEEFNSWRKEHDYPRIINYLKNNLTNFEQWMKEQKVLYDDLSECGPAVFLKPSKEIIIYELKNHDDEIVKEIRKEVYNVGEVVFHDKFVVSKKEVVTYFEWAKKDEDCIKNRDEINFFINRAEGRKAFLQGLELLDIGDISLPHNFIMGKRDLSFLNLNNLVINHCFGGELTLWYCSAINLNIYGDLAFVNIFKTKFTQAGSWKSSLLHLHNGTYQNWTILHTDVSLFADNATLFRWDVTGSMFNINIEHSDIKECDFKENEIKYPQDYKKAANFHKAIKLVYSKIGQTSNAGKHFYKEKSFEQKSLLKVKHTFGEKLYKEKNKLRKAKIYFNAYLEYLNLSFQKILWGFGEKPSRVFTWALFTIIISYFLYQFNPKSATYCNSIDSLYYSIVTFTTLGYGDIQQTNSFLKLYSSIEAFLGLSLMALAVAGFASKSKDYS